MRNRIIPLLAALCLIAVTNPSPGAAHHIKADLVPSDGSSVSGFVELTQLPHGGANVHVVARGLQPGTEYASFYYESADCTEPADLLGTFSGGDDGNGEVHGKIDDDLD